MDDQTTELHRLLAAALEIADQMGLTMVAIHIDEARSLLAAQDATSTH